MCDYTTCYRPKREIEEQLIEEYGLSDLTISECGIDEKSDLFVMTLENMTPGDVIRLERSGWVFE